MTDRDNRRSLNLLDENLVPESTAGKVALAPVALPVGTAAFVADLMLVHPACTIDDAWLDTVDLLWTSREESTLRRVLFMPLAAAATPLVFVGDWAGRWLFPIPERRPVETPGTGAEAAR